MAYFDLDHFVGDVLVTLDYSRLGVERPVPILGVRVACMNDPDAPLPPQESWPVLNAAAYHLVCQGKNYPHPLYDQIIHRAGQKICDATDRIRTAAQCIDAFPFPALPEWRPRDAMTAAALVTSRTLADGWLDSIAEQYGPDVLEGKLSDTDAEIFSLLENRNQLYYAMSNGAADYNLRGLAHEAHAFLNLAGERFCEPARLTMTDETMDLLSCRFGWCDKQIVAAPQEYPAWLNGLAAYFGPKRGKQIWRFTPGDSFNYPHAKN